MKTRNLTHSLLTTAAMTALVTSTILAPGMTIAVPSYTGLGLTSTATLNMEVDKPVQANISGMTDILVATYVINDPDQIRSSTACVYTTSGAYTLVATGSGTAGAFTLEDGVSTGPLHVLPYTANWNDGGSVAGQLAGTSGTALTAASAPAAFTRASVVSSDCSTGAGTAAPAGNNAKINITFAATDLTALASGTFSGTLALLVAPN